MTIEKFATGIQGLDLITHGGIPKGRATLIAGRSGAGKSILALQLACCLAKSGRKTIFLAVEEEPADLATTGDALGFGFTGSCATASSSSRTSRRRRTRSTRSPATTT